MAANPRTPWTRADAVTVAGLMTVGALIWFSGWWAVSDRPSMEAQIAPMNIVVLGVVLIAAGQGLWFLRGRRAIGERRRVLLGAVALVPVSSPAATDDAFAGSERFFHRLDCVLAGDRTWTPTSRAVHERAGRIPCGVCEP